MEYALLLLIAVAFFVIGWKSHAKHERDKNNYLKREMDGESCEQ